jgi:hypothetical protein
LNKVNFIIKKQLSGSRNWKVFFLFHREIGAQF